MEASENASGSATLADRFCSFRGVKVALLVLSLEYSLGALAGLVGVVAPPRSPALEEMRPKLIRAGLIHTLPTIVCGTAFILVLRRSKSSEIAAAAAVCIVGYFTVKAFDAWLHSGAALFLLEPVVNTPCITIIITRMVRARLTHKP
jgi:hypothetical protein